MDVFLVEWRRVNILEFVNRGFIAPNFIENLQLSSDIIINYQLTEHIVFHSIEFKTYQSPVMFVFLSTSEESDDFWNQLEECKKHIDFNILIEQKILENH